MAANPPARPIYLVSASPLMRHSHECLFRALGAEVGSYDSLEGFLRQFPGGSGFLCIDAQEPMVPPAGCLRLLRKRRALLPVVLLVDHLPADYQAALGRLYAPLQVLTKPVSGRLLLEAVATLLRAPSP
jgi:FixJ family two-component response regulator